MKAQKLRVPKFYMTKEDIASLLLNYMVLFLEILRNEASLYWHSSQHLKTHFILSFYDNYIFLMKTYRQI